MTPLSTNKICARLGRLRSFTIVELLVVVAVIGILLGMVLPNAAKMWSQRNEAATYNMIRGLLESARTQAIRNGERGLFFFLDDKGTQRVVFIRGEGPEYSGEGRDDDDCLAPPNPPCIKQTDAVDRFRVMPGQMYLIPKPYRVAPDWAVNKAAFRAETGWDDARYFDILNVKALKLANGQFTPYYQRNCFAIIFNNRGEIAPNRNVLVHDPDYVEQPPSDTDNKGNGLGDATRLPASEVQKYWDVNQSGGTLIGQTSGRRLFDMITLTPGDNVAANFRSVAGLVVYDDSNLEGLDGAGIADVIGRTGQPCFVNRYTGEVVFGKKGS